MLGVPKELQTSAHGDVEIYHICVENTKLANIPLLQRDLISGSSRTVQLPIVVSYESNAIFWQSSAHKADNMVDCLLHDRVTPATMFNIDSE